MPLQKKRKEKKLIYNRRCLYCSFIAGSVVRQGPLVITISTSGAAPALAVRLRERFQQEFGPSTASSWK